jgi:2-polyprenyl-3-methyl-5-hydroxy-6-metoxy-1,4-benzoquinol methylase
MAHRIHQLSTETDTGPTCASSTIGRYWTLIGYMDAFKRGGEYLDVGCGDGVLFERFKPLGYQRYVGIDISHVAIEKLRLHNDDRTNFTQADGDVHEAAGRFDVIIFNESLYYLRDPVRSLERYAQSLKPGGCIIVSTYTASRRSRAVLREAKRGFEVLDEAKTTQGPMSWLCTVLKHSKAGATSLGVLFWLSGVVALVEQ